jgi:transposase
MQLFKGENLQCLAEGLTNIFKHIGGVPTRIWFDSLPAVVKKILKNDERELTDDFLRFMNHYGLPQPFAAPVAEMEKGHVKNKVGYHCLCLFLG